MNKEIKFVKINNIKFDTPLSSKQAFKRYKKEFWNKFAEKFDLVEFGSPIGNIIDFTEKELKYLKFCDED